MTLVAPAVPQLAQRSSINSNALVGFGIVLLAAAAPLHNVQLWIGLTDSVRWNYTGFAFAVTALGACGWMLTRQGPTRLPMFSAALASIAVVSAGAVITGHMSLIYSAFYGSGEDDYLNAILDILGNKALFYSAVAGLVSILVPQSQRHFPVLSNQR